MIPDWVYFLLMATGATIAFVGGFFWHDRRPDIKAAYLDGVEDGAWSADHAELPEAEREKLWHDSDTRRTLLGLPLDK